MPQRIWNLIPEPRIITAITAIGWAIFGGIGLVAIIQPPQTISYELGEVLSVIWAWSLFGGAALGGIGALSGWWWVERGGIMAAAMGTVTYLTVVLILHFTEYGSRLVQAGFIILALILLSLRWLRIRGPQVDPMRGMDFRDDH